MSNDDRYYDGDRLTPLFCGPATVRYPPFCGPFGYRGIIGPSNLGYYYYPERPNTHPVGRMAPSRWGHVYCNIHGCQFTCRKYEIPTPEQFIDWLKAGIPCDKYTEPTHVKEYKRDRHLERLEEMRAEWSNINRKAEEDARNGK